ncbi:MAG: PTS sugar transporter subunit IIA [Devosia sp.]
MELGDLLTRDGIIPSLKAKTKKLALQELAERAALVTGLPVRDILEALSQRERLGSTGLGRGIAIPHAKMKGLEQIHCLFARLEQAIDFEALDGEPVDLVFILLAPEHASGDHLKALARISRLLREPHALERLRAARDKSSLYAVLTQPLASNAA